MKLAPIAYLRPRSEAELLAALAQHGADAVVLAGGQSLMPELALRKRSPRVVVDINHLAHADVIDGSSLATGELRIGARVRHRDVACHEGVRLHVPLLASAAAHVGNAAVRNRGTLCGSLAHADPAGEFPLAAVALNASVLLRSTTGDRSLGADAFFTGAFTTARRPDEFLSALHVPCAAQPGFQFFDEIARRPTAPAVAAIALVAHHRAAGDDGLRIAFGGLSDRPRLLPATGNGCARRPTDAAGLRAIMFAELGPLVSGDDAAYRLHLAATLLERARTAFCLHLKESSVT